jgi:hypothetical protein
MVATKEPKVKKSKKIKSEKPRKPKLVKLYDTELDPLKEADGLLKQIETAESEAAERSLRVELCREELTDAKTAYKDAVAQLRKLCRARKEKHPLFDQTKKDKPAELTKDPPADGPVKEHRSESQEINKAWQDLPLSSAGIDGHVGVLLAEAGHDTLGRLAKLMGDHGQWWNKEVKGIGEAGATEVADLFAAFWADHPEYCAG